MSTRRSDQSASEKAAGTRAKLDKVGAVASHSTPAAMAKLLADDSLRFGDLVKKADIKAD